MAAGFVTRSSVTNRANIAAHFVSLMTKRAVVTKLTCDNNLNTTSKLSHRKDRAILPM